MFSAVSAWLKGQNIIVPEDWIEACVQWLESEKRNTKDLALLKRLVYEQWLLTDLADLRQPVIPQEIMDEKYLFKGNLCLQINHLIDVSQAKYSQLQEIQNKQNANHFVCAETQTTQRPWETKPTRMFMITLSDGVVEVSGMEYNSIPKLNKKISPGTKVRIKGPVLCRKGVMMLKQANVEILGGIVEDLAGTNNYEAILCRGLGKPIPRVTSQTQDELSDEVLDELMADVDFDDDAVVKPSVSAPQGSRNESKSDARPNRQSAKKEFKNDKVDDVITIDDDIIDVDDITDMDEFFADVEEEEKELVCDVHPCSSERGTSNYGQSGTSKESGNLWKRESSFPGEKISSYFSGGNVSSSKVRVEGGISSKVGQSEKKENTNSWKKELVHKENTIHDQSYSRTKIEPDLLKKEIPINERDKRSSTSRMSSSMYSLPKHMQNPFDKKPFPIVASQRTKSSNDATKEIPLKAAKIESISDYTSAKTDTVSKAKVLDSRETSTYSLENKPGPSTKQNSNQKGFQTKNVNQKPEGCSNASLEYKYLCHVKHDLKQNQKSTNVIAHVKALVITLLSKLKADILNGWSLTARICDGTETLDVDFSNDVLTNLIGFTVEQAEEVKVKPKDSPDRNKLSDGMDRCRETIITMCHYMTVEIHKNVAGEVISVVTNVEF